MVETPVLQHQYNDVFDIAQGDTLGSPGQGAEEARGSKLGLHSDSDTKQ